MTMDQIIEVGLYQIIFRLYAQLLPAISHTKSQFFFYKISFVLEFKQLL